MNGVLFTWQHCVLAGGLHQTPRAMAKTTARRCRRLQFATCTIQASVPSGCGCSYLSLPVNASPQCRKTLILRAQASAHGPLELQACSAPGLGWAKQGGGEHNSCLAQEGSSSLAIVSRDEITGISDGHLQHAQVVVFAAHELPCRHAHCLESNFCCDCMDQNPCCHRRPRLMCH